MNNLFEAWRTARPPYYDKKYKQTLIREFSDYGGRNTNFKAFDSAYEFYIYAFFVGLYYNELKPISSKDDFGHKIEFWGNKAGKRDRKDFTILQKYIFVALIAKTDVDLLALERGNLTETDVVNKLMETMEMYANGGMRIIRERFEDDENFFYTPTGFLNFILEANGD
jgi:hypothetical protein